jgi:hypothetical protein
LEKPFQGNEPNHENEHPNDKRDERSAAAATTGTAAPASHDDWPDWFRFRCVLQIRIAVNRERFRNLKRLQVRRHIHLEEFAVDDQEPFRVSEAGELREIFVLDVVELGGPDLRLPPRFIERETARKPGFL